MTDSPPPRSPDTTPSGARRPSRWPAAIAAPIVGCACAIVMLCIATRLPMTWDEGNAILRSQAIGRWFQSWRNTWQAPPPGGPGQPLDAWAARFAPLRAESIRTGWPYTTTIEGHPAFYGLLIAGGAAVAPESLPSLVRYRFGPILFFSLALGAAFYRLWRHVGPAAAVIGTLALLTLPRLLAHAHFASFDGPLTAAWLLSWAAFAPARRGGTFAVLAFTLSLGMVLSAKFTGWLAPPAFALGCLFQGDRRGLRTLCLATVGALLVFLALNPPLWHQPLAGLQTFLSLNLHRAARPQHNITTQFLGRLYNLDYPLPWYNSLLWTATATPFGTLLLAAAGLYNGWNGNRSRGSRGNHRAVSPAPSSSPPTSSISLSGSLPPNRFVPRPSASPTRCTPPRPNADNQHAARRLAATTRMLAAHWLVPLLVRALPWAPPHDGIRLFLPGFAFLALLAGIGGQSLLRYPVARRPSHTPGRRGAFFIKQSPASPSSGFAFAPLASRLAPALLVLWVLGNLTTLWAYWPQWLSHYNLFIGGLPGAVRRGMEPTYYWDSLDAEVLDWLHQHTRSPADKLRWGAPSTENLWLMQRWGVLRRGFRPQDPGNYRFYIIQHRPSVWQPWDRWLVEHAEPVFRKTLRPPGWGFGPWRLDTTLLEIYTESQYAAARAKYDTPSRSSEK